MSLVRKVFSDSSFTALRNIFSLARGLILLPLITKLLGAESYGLWVTILAITGLLGSVGGLHLHGSLIRFKSKEGVSNQVFSDVLFLASITGIILAALVIIIGLIINLTVFFGGGLANNSALIAIIPVILISDKIMNVSVNFPRAKGYVRGYDAALIVSNLLETILLAVVFLTGNGIVTALAGLAGLKILMNIAILSIIVTRFRLPFPDQTNFSRYIRYGVPMIPKEVSSQLLNSADKYFLIYFSGPAAVGIYAAAQAISRPLMRLSTVFDPTLYPTISKAWDDSNYNGITNIYNGIFRFYTIFAIPAALGIVLLSNSLLTVISTNRIALEGKYLVPIFVTGYFLKGYDNSIRYILTSSERTDIIGGSVVVSVVVNVILNILLIPKYGMLGAAVATFTSQILLFVIILRYCLIEITLNIPWSSIIRSFIATMVMGAFLSLITQYVDYNHLVLYPGVGILVYFSTLIILGEFSKSELIQVLNHFSES